MDQEQSQQHPPYSRRYDAENPTVMIARESPTLSYWGVQFDTTAWGWLERARIALVRHRVSEIAIERPPRQQ